MILPADRKECDLHPRSGRYTLKPVVQPEVVAQTEPVALPRAFPAPIGLMPPGFLPSTDIPEPYDRELVIQMLHYLMGRPSFDDIAQHLVLTLTPRHGTKAALIGECHPDGTLSALGAFGLVPTITEPLTQVSLWDSSPLSDAIRTGRPVLCSRRGEAAARYPSLTVLRAVDDPTLAWPLALPSQLVGGMQLFFHKGLEAQAVQRDLTGIGAVLALYVSLLRLGPTQPAPHEDPRRSPSPSRKSAEPQSLSNRQRAILHQVAGGRTNAQIARALGFSESTIRQETIAIYRALGVSDRHAAVRQARANGLLTD